LALYRKEYGCLPVPAGRSTFEYGPSNYVDLLSVLYGKNSQLNRRNVVILEPTLGTNEFRDPWGMPYFVRLTQTRNASDVGKVEIWSEGSGDSILLEEDRTVISRDIKKD